MSHPLIALDAAYSDGAQSIAAVVFPEWSSPSVARVWSDRIAEPPAPYRPGRFYERELPLLLRALSALGEEPAAVIIDGYVALDAAGRPGLGAHLHEAIGKRIPVVGVAKTAFRGSGFAVPVLRGLAKNPLYVSAIGVEEERAAEYVLSMAGAHRLPAHLKLVDLEARRALGC